MSFKTAGFPDFRFSALGFRSRNNLLKKLIKNCGLLSYSKGVTGGLAIDKVGRSTRTSIKAKYILGDGILTANIGLNNEPLTYLDGDTLLDVAGTTDGSGFFTFPSGVKVANVKITSTGDIFYLQEGIGDTIADSVNGRIAKLSASPTFVDINTIKSQADAVGYTVSDNATYFWDEATTDLIANNVIIPNLPDGKSVAYIVAILPWILANGVWNDSGAWDDTANWID